MKGVDSLLWFDYPSEFYEFCATQPRTSVHSASIRNTKDFAGTKTYEEADTLAKKGWKEGVEMARPLTVRLSHELIESLKRPQITYDVLGDMFDMGKVMEGEPECWMQWEEGQEPSSIGPVRLILNCTVSAGVSQETIERRGCAMLALIMVLEQANRSTQVEVFESVNDLSSHIEFGVTLKRFYEDPQYDALAYGLMHPSFLRRHMFRGCEILGIHSSNYGMPTESQYVPYDPKDKGVIYMGMAHAGQFNWNNDTEVMKWIMKELKRQHVTFT